LNKKILSKSEAWLLAVRLRTLPLALSSIFAGSFLAYWKEELKWEVLVLASLTTIFLQVLSNLSNDYGDSVHGADSSARQGPLRAVQSGSISLSEMKVAMGITGALSFCSGLLLLYFSLSNWMLFSVFLVLGLAAIWAAIRYTSGKNPYGYAGWGDLSVFVFFGLLGVCGTYFLHTQKWELGCVLIAISLGCFSTAVLTINNIRDMESDQKAGKKSIPVRLGRKRALIYLWLLVGVGQAALVLFSLQIHSLPSLAPLLVAPFMFGIVLGVQRASSAEATDPYLKKMALATLLWTLLFGLGLSYA
jgi:1,4-dihydroxy-2-naphthoate octaprenyltransferase